MRHLAILGAALVCTGCYVRSAVVEPTPAFGTEVEVTLTSSFSTDSGAPIGAGIHVLDGRVLKSGPDTLALAVTRALGFDEMSTQKWHRDRVPVPRWAVATVERRRLSIVRSGLLAGGVLAASVALFIAARNSSPYCPGPAYSC